MRGPKRARSTAGVQDPRDHHTLAGARVGQQIRDLQRMLRALRHASRPVGIEDEVDRVPDQLDIGHTLWSASRERGIAWGTGSGAPVVRPVLARARCGREAAILST
jgi:hypothetical protein